MDNSRLLIPRQKFKIPVMGGSLQTVQVKKLIQGNHDSIMDRHPNRHTTNDRPTCIRDELARCNIQGRMEFHKKGINWKTKAT